MRKRLLLILGVVCLFLFLSSAVKAEILSVPACGFIAAGHQAEQLQLDTDYGGYIYRKGTTEDVFFTPVYLPHGKIIKWVKFHVVDDDANYEMACVLVRGNKYSGTRSSIYVVWTSGASSSLRQFTDASPYNPAHALVNNDVCTYWIGVVFKGGPSGEARKVYGISIYYE